MGQLSLPGYISSFEPPRPDNAPRNARDLRPSLSLSLSLSPNPLGSSHRRALRTSLSPPVSKTADFTSVRSAEHCRPSRHRTRNARGAPPRFGERGKVSPGAVSPFAKLAPGLAYGLPTFIPPPIPAGPARYLFSCFDVDSIGLSAIFQADRQSLVDNEVAFRDISREKRMLMREIFGLYTFARIFGDPCIRQISSRRE